MPSADINSVVATLTIAAGLALCIERTIEILKHFIDTANGSLGNGERRDVIETAELAIAEARTALSDGKVGGKSFTAPATAAAEQQVVVEDMPKRYAGDSEANEEYPAPTIPVISPTPISTLKTAYQLFILMAASGLGIIFAQLFQIRLLAVMTSKNINAAPSLSFVFADIIFTGLVIGGGSQPIHILIRFLTERKVDLDDSEATKVNENAKYKSLDTVVSASNLVEEKQEPNALQWMDIAYRGGVNPDSLQNTHQRPGNPNLIIYHHTAMSSATSFRQVVDEFQKSKQWLTGYNCVIMPDGEINSFCRWDRYGNHAKEFNPRSLGLAFHGNFHTAPGDQFSNADGRYGNQQPTEAQLHAGARVVALWIFLYEDIKLDFEQNIRAHKEVMPGHTVCPGSNFKYEEFKQLIRQYHDAWANSHEVLQKIEDFKKLKYIYV